MVLRLQVLGTKGFNIKGYIDQLRLIVEVGYQRIVRIYILLF